MASTKIIIMRVHGWKWAKDAWKPQLIHYTILSLDVCLFLPPQFQIRIFLSIFQVATLPLPPPGSTLRKRQRGMRGTYFLSFILPLWIARWPINSGNIFGTLFRLLLSLRCFISPFPPFPSQCKDAIKGKVYPKNQTINMLERFPDAGCPPPPSATEHPISTSTASTWARPRSRLKSQTSTTAKTTKNQVNVELCACVAKKARTRKLSFFSICRLRPLEKLWVTRMPCTYRSLLCFFAPLAPSLSCRTQ
jgi:hypothetical protein